MTHSSLIGETATQDRSSFRQPSFRNKMDQVGPSQVSLASMEKTWMQKNKQWIRLASGISAALIVIGLFIWLGTNIAGEGAATVSGGKRCAADEKDVSCEQNPFAVGVKRVKVGVHGGQEHEEGQQCADEDCKQGEKGKSANAFGVGIRRVKVGVHQ